MPGINLIDFFKYYKGTVEQQEAVQLLQSAMPETLKRDKSAWVVKFREAPAKSDSGIPQDAVDLIKEFEGFRSAVYDDGVGVATIGYGATFYQSGQKVGWNDPPITEAQGEELLKYHLEYFYGTQESTIPYFEEMSDGKRGCLLSFSFNVGAHFYAANGFATITGCLRDRRWNDVPNALLLYVNPGSSVEAGLRRRREAEIQLWNS
tara:strand:- start:1720 stop:2337 length:618 start_codon:yes stop_codon:yes gene_type:complete